ncbi:monovalent cation/H+ antiporter complex subunit F [Streptomyces sp. SCSIO 75703]|uniref:monovalent cation/H+ antiporter complex subunit F n=1 Tax=unclassified Streptomyces TaxID=2593676 RepID=UPI0004BFDF7B|nr:MULTISPECIES: monovalent cation/H+ antiporter complex subunit F [unclassified Streptomyces]
MTTLHTVEDALLVASVVVILAAGALLLYRIWSGPSMLDRAVALDVAAALIIAGIGAKAALSGDPFYYPVMLVLAFLGFTGSVGIARFIAVRDRPAIRPDGTEDHR